MHLAVVFAALLQAACGQTDYSKAANTESVKEHIRALYMNMDVPEIGPGGDGTGALNVSLSIGSILKVANHHLDIAFTLDLRWRHKFLDMLVDAMEAIPLNREKLWTPQFVFVNVQSVTEDQSSLYLHLSRLGAGSRAVVYKLWHRANVRCDGPSMQHPFGDILCVLIFEEANPENQRSVHMTLGRQHQMNCTRVESQRYSFVYRLSKPFSDNGRKFQFWARICIRSSLEEMLPAVRQYGLSFIMVLLSLTTVYFFDRTTRLFINLALLHILIFNWSPTGQHLNAIDIWYAMCTFVICCCLLAALAKRFAKEEAREEAADEGDATTDPEELLHVPRSTKHSYNGKDPRSSKCTAITESSDNLDLFGLAELPPTLTHPPHQLQHQHQQHQHQQQQQQQQRLTSERRRLRQRRGQGRDSNLGRQRSGCSLLAMIVLPVWWTLFVITFWASVLLTAPNCEKLTPECFNSAL